MSSGLVQFPGTKDYARANADRQARQFACARQVLEQLGLKAKIEQANSFDELRKIVFDADAVEVMQAIQDKLHPASGQKDADFIGWGAGPFKRLLRNQFEDMKKDRANELKKPRGGKGAAGAGASRPYFDWTNDLKLDAKHCVRPLLTNLILYQRYHPDWDGVLGFDEFAARVVIRKRPPWGNEQPDTPWTDHHDAQTRVWFQPKISSLYRATLGVRCRQRRGIILFIRSATTLMR